MDKEGFAGLSTYTLQCSVRVIGFLSNEWCHTLKRTQILHFSEAVLQGVLERETRLPLIELSHELGQPASSSHKYILATYFYTSLYVIIIHIIFSFVDKRKQDHTCSKKQR
jgi:uncharacterized membrane protein YagU involved in acid resistance